MYTVRIQNGPYLTKMGFRLLLLWQQIPLTPTGDRMHFKFDADMPCLSYELQNWTFRLFGSFLGHRRNGLATSACSNCIRM